MRNTTLTIIALALVVALGAGAALATPPFGLTSQLLGRGTADGFRVQDKSQRLQLHAMDPTDIAVVKATLAAPAPATTTPAVPAGSTGWPGHPGPSLVVVSKGMLTMYERRGRKCHAETFAPGQSFVHPDDMHDFVNTGTDTVEFYVVYFAPAGVSLLRDEPAPPECAGL